MGGDYRCNGCHCIIERVHHYYCDDCGDMLCYECHVSFEKCFKCRSNDVKARKDMYDELNDAATISGPCCECDAVPVLFRPSKRQSKWVLECKDHLRVYGVSRKDIEDRWNRKNV